MPRSGSFVAALPDRASEPRPSHLYTVHALAITLKRAHFAALLRQVARDEATHGMGLPRFAFGSRSEWRLPVGTTKSRPVRVSSLPETAAAAALLSSVAVRLCDSLLFAAEWLARSVLWRFCDP